MSPPTHSASQVSSSASDGGPLTQRLVPVANTVRIGGVGFRSRLGHAAFLSLCTYSQRLMLYYDKAFAPDSCARVLLLAQTLFTVRLRKQVSESKDLEHSLNTCE